MQYQYSQDPAAAFPSVGGAFQATMASTTVPAAAVPADVQYAPDPAMAPQHYGMPAMNPYYSRGEAHSLDQYSMYKAQNQTAESGEGGLQPQVISRGFVPKRKNKFAPPAQPPMPTVPETETQYYNPEMYVGMQQPSVGPPFPPYAPGTRPPQYVAYYTPFGYFPGFTSHPDYNYQQHYANNMYGYAPSAFPSGVSAAVTAGMPAGTPVMAPYYPPNEPAQVQFQSSAKQVPQKVKTEEKRKKKWKGPTNNNRERSNSDVGGETKKEEDIQTKHMSSTECSIDSFGSFNYEAKGEDQEIEKDRLSEKFAKLAVASSGSNASGASRQAQAEGSIDYKCANLE